MNALKHKPFANFYLLTSTCGIGIINDTSPNATGKYDMKSRNTSIKMSLRHLMYRGILGNGVAVTPNISKGLRYIFLFKLVG